MKNKITLSGTFIVLIGMILSLAVIFFKTVNTPANLLQSVICEFLLAISIGLITMGILSIILGLKDWQIYFQQRLSEVIRQKEYIRSLNKDELIQLQRDTFRAYFDIDLEGNQNNFLSFFENELQHFIGSPYREDINYFMDVKAVNGDGLEIEENIRFRAKSVAGKIQDSINWIASEDEYVSFDFGEVKIKPSRPFSGDVTVDDDGYYKLTDKEIKLIDGGLGFRASLEKFMENEFVDVIISAKYKAHPKRSLSWTMSQLTDRFTITINYPEKMSSSFEVLGINKDNIQVNKGRSIITIKCNTWALPNTGVVLGLYSA